MVHGDMRVSVHGDPTFDTLGVQPVLTASFPHSQSASAGMRAALPAVLEAGGTLPATPRVPGGPTLPAVHSWAENTPSLGLMMALERTNKEFFFVLEFPDLMILRFHYLRVLWAYSMNILILRFCDSQIQSPHSFLHHRLSLGSVLRSTTG